MKILITNDDGIYSPGILELAEVASEFGEVRIVAPDVEQSSMGHAVTATRPLSYKRTHVGDFDAYRVNGTPADCVSLGSFHWDKVDVVLSGINLGPNLGNSMWHSGTLAGAKQAALLGIKGIAFSTPTQTEEYDFSKMRPYTRQVLDYLISEDGPKLVNVNFPFAPKGIMWTRQSVRQYDGLVKPSEDPMGRKHFWFTVVPLENPDEGTDRYAIENDLVSMTPLSLDLTDENQLKKLTSLNMFSQKQI
ncbi:5'/3'-nucleotidase SurE [Algoriphagus halophytocola]|uniref:5'-nucleotidase SurE n=1 Tax=Algoriphagus halophytocola TaxID=2991499 RepID=A0ABY6MI91_9BACT|nr:MULTISPECIES: 5'/3'-nucleotidase SurE [unclassified Algoriphagus]UZD22918.1 5'/3'-nucleotidase SurE [Algoriphagus sp. TR-M5]WBL44186.1 5'/3'-nucleotidase SurE [Algoriphagus sp. TR-M9]